jgi:adsorption protein B
LVWLDYWAAACLVALAFWILFSGLDDLFIGLIRYCRWRSPVTWPDDGEIERAEERRIAVLVPLWREDRVIRRMLERNLAAIEYGRYDVFVGIYPNDEPTAQAVREIACAQPRVHVAMGRRDGPTSKGDCLNSIYDSVRQYEARHAVTFDVIVIHDAEDLIHPKSLRTINWFLRDYEMVQIPVLPLPTPWYELTHGLYCDEFAEYQSKDIPVRQRLGGFVPSNGVGTGYARAALERLAEARGGRVFDAEALTEDYETGLCLHELGCRQAFVPIRFLGGGPLATREYFPRTLRNAIRQRSRWVAGISLQGWERHGWRGPWSRVYWFFRDRKGLAGNLLAPVANLVFVYGLITYAISAAHGRPWDLGRHIPTWVSFSTLVISLAQMAMRIQASARIYGPRLAAGVPLRMLWGVLVNYIATAEALRQFLWAHLGRTALAWRKTDHIYPAHATREQGRPLLGEVLLRTGRLTASELERSLGTLCRGTRIGEHLVRCGMLSEDHLYQALSLQSGIPWGMPDRRELSPPATRLLPAGTSRRWRVLPYRVESGQLHVITAEIPTERMARELERLSALELRFRLVAPRDFHALAEEFLPQSRARR